MGLTVTARLQLIKNALDKHALSEYGVGYELARQRSSAVKDEFENLYFIIGGVIDAVELILKDGAKNG